MFKFYSLNTIIGDIKMTTIAMILAGILWTATMIWTGYMLRRLDEEVEHAEIRARIWEALMKKESDEA